MGGYTTNYQVRVSRVGILSPRNIRRRIFFALLDVSITDAAVNLARRAHLARRRLFRGEVASEKFRRRRTEKSIRGKPNENGEEEIEISTVAADNIARRRFAISPVC